MSGSTIGAAPELIRCYLIGVDIDAPDRVAAGGETARRDGSRHTPDPNTLIFIVITLSPTLSHTVASTTTENSLLRQPVENTRSSFAEPSSSSTFGSHPSNCLARRMSGRRTFGSSTGKGICSILLFEPVSLSTNSCNLFDGQLTRIPDIHRIVHRSLERLLGLR